MKIIKIFVKATTSPNCIGEAQFLGIKSTLFSMFKETGGSIQTEMIHNYNLPSNRLQHNYKMSSTFNGFSTKPPDIG